MKRSYFFIFVFLLGGVFGFSLTLSSSIPSGDCPYVRGVSNADVQNAINKIKQEISDPKAQQMAIDDYLEGLREGGKLSHKYKEMLIEKEKAGVWQNFIAQDILSFRTLGFVAAGAAAMYGLRSGIKAIIRKIESHGKNPIFVNDTNHYTVWDEMYALVSGKEIAYTKSTNALFFNEELQAEMDRALKEFENLSEFNVALSHRLFYGPPGTGKTEMAKRLATETGLGYYILNGATYATHEREGVDHWNNLMEEVRTADKRFVIFIDEAEKLLCKRTYGNSGAFISSFLQLTGGANNKKFCFVLATNHPEMIDEAVLSRCSGEWLKFDLPNQITREKMLRSFINTYFKEEVEKEGLPKIDLSIFSEENMSLLACQTEGFSGRELVRMIEKIFRTTLQRTEKGKKPVVEQAVVDLVLKQFKSGQNSFNTNVVPLSVGELPTVSQTQHSPEGGKKNSPLDILTETARYAGVAGA